MNVLVSRLPLDNSDQTPVTGDYVTPERLAAALGVSVRTLSRWHAERRGPPRCAIGKTILYRIAGVRDWLASQETEPVRPASAARPRGGRR